MDKKAQNIVEYLLFITVIIVVLVIFLGPTGPFRGAVNRALDGSINQLENIASSTTF